MKTENCAGCMYLDQNRQQPKGNGYCSHVERSTTQNKKVRRDNMERCELYRAGDFAKRFMEDAL